METIILAAGFAKRMGENKLHLHIDGVPLLQRAVEVAVKVSSKVIVVTGTLYDPTEVLSPLCSLYKGLIVTISHQKAYLGQFSSTQVGVAALSQNTPFAIAVADTPLITPLHYNKLLSYLPSFDAVRPFYRSIPGHPVLCAPSLREEILSLPLSTTMREFLSHKQVFHYEDDDIAWVTDIDTPDDYTSIVKFMK